MDIAEQPPRLTPSERLDLVRELAVLPGVRGICLDTTFRHCKTPDPVLNLGVVPADERRDPGEVRDTLSRRENAALMGAIGRARLTGAADLVIHPAPDGAPSHVAIIDLAEQYGVYVALTGDGIHVPHSAATTEKVRPRRVVHHRNEIAELTWVDPLTEDMLGLDPREMTGRSALHYIHPDDHDRGINEWLSLLAGHPSVRHRVRWRTGTDEWRWLELTHTDRLASHGYVETEMVDVEEEMRALDRAREGEVRFNTLTESLPMGVIHVGADGAILYINSWLRDFASFDETAPVGHRFPSVHPDDREPLATAFAAASAEGTESDLDARITRRRRNDERICRVRVRPVGDADADGTRAAIASVEDITESVNRESHLRRKAMTDDLTGLDNRTALIEQLQARLDHPYDETGVAALFLDFDGFKMINDGLGHDAGDDLLVEAARRLSATLRSGDSIARSGGDEFVVVLDDCPDLDARQRGLLLLPLRRTAGRRKVPEPEPEPAAVLPPDWPAAGR